MQKRSGSDKSTNSAPTSRVQSWRKLEFIQRDIEVAVASGLTGEQYDAQLAQKLKVMPEHQRADVARYIREHFWQNAVRAQQTPGPEKVMKTEAVRRRRTTAKRLQEQTEDAHKLLATKILNMTCGEVRAMQSAMPFTRGKDNQFVRDVYTSQEVLDHIRARQ